MPSGLKGVDQRVDVWRRDFQRRPVVIDNLYQYWDVSKTIHLGERHFVYEDDASDQLSTRIERGCGSLLECALQLKAGCKIK